MASSSVSNIPPEWTNTWNLFDDRHTGFVTHTDLKHILRSLGRRHTEAEFKHLLQTIPDPVSYDTFVHIMQQPYSGPTEEDLHTALRAFDASDCGALKLTELVTLLSSLGERIPEGEVRQLLDEVHVDAEGRVGIDELVQFLCSPVPTTTPDIAELQRQLGQQAMPTSPSS